MKLLLCILLMEGSMLGSLSSVLLCSSVSSGAFLSGTRLLQVSAGQSGFSLVMADRYSSYGIFQDWYLTHEFEGASEGKFTSSLFSCSHESQAD